MGWFGPTGDCGCCDEPSSVSSVSTSSISSVSTSLEIPDPCLCTGLSSFAWVVKYTFPSDTFIYYPKRTTLGAINESTGWSCTPPQFDMPGPITAVVSGLAALNGTYVIPLQLTEDCSLFVEYANTIIQGEYDLTYTNTLGDVCSRTNTISLITHSVQKLLFSPFSLCAFVSAWTYVTQGGISLTQCESCPMDLKLEPNIGNVIVSWQNDADEEFNSIIGEVSLSLDTVLG